MIHLTVLLLVSLQTCSGVAVRAQQRAGFSVACQGLRTIGQMTREAEIVTEARVVDVSPARDNVYAVTLQVSLSCQHDSWESNVIFIFQVLQIFKGKPKKGEQAVGPLVQLLFLKPREKKKQEVRSVKEPRKYLEACIYEMGLKKGKKYNLFLASQPGKMGSKKGRMARFVMTSPPVLSSKKSSRRILAVTCPSCGECYRLTMWAHILHPLSTSHLTPHTVMTSVSDGFILTSLTEGKGVAISL